MESAIVLPLFVFLILGVLQLGLMHQARLLTKYAAYKAVRAGALHNANVQKMERAALAVLLPLVSRAGGGGAEFIKTIGSASDFQAKWQWPEVVGNRMPDAGMRYVQVTICGPLRGEFSGGEEVDFDDPEIASSPDWGQAQRTKLRIQVLFNYRMPIPFANAVIFNIMRAREVASVLMLGKPGEKEIERKGKQQQQEQASGNTANYDSAGEAKVYVAPIRATYTMRMQSNLYLSTHPLPEANQCVFSH